MLKYWVWLAECKGLNNQIRLALLDRFATPEDVFCADTEELALTEGITKANLQALENHDLTEADRILGECQRLNIHLLTIRDGAYPGILRNIYDPPCLLYWKGHLPVFDEECSVAAVGTRNCTPYGENCAEKLGFGLAAGGAVVVSGLAKGIDAAAARGALKAGGKVAAVVGNGLDVIYPAGSRYLYEDITAAGVLISEYPPGTEPAGRHFPARNRILSGLSRATVVVEAPEKSGALITAATALEQGRDVFAVPGPIDAPNSVGCNRLIRDGAGLVSEPWDILREYAAQYPGKLHSGASREEPGTLGYQAREIAEAKTVTPTLKISEAGVELTDDQIALLHVLSEQEPMLVDDLVEITEIPARRVLSALTMLEIDQYILQHSGKRYTRIVTLKE